MDMTINFMIDDLTFQSKRSEIVSQIFHDIWKKYNSGDRQGFIFVKGRNIGRWATARIGNMPTPNMLITFEMEGREFDADEIRRILNDIALDYKSGKIDGTILKEKQIGSWTINA